MLFRNNIEEALAVIEMYNFGGQKCDILAINSNELFLSNVQSSNRAVFNIR
jgi:hypothetical protein